MDDELRARLWNCLDSCYWRRVPDHHLGATDHPAAEGVRVLLFRVWDRFWKKPLDSIPAYWSEAYRTLRERFFACPWNEAYDFVEFVAQEHPSPFQNTFFTEECNHVLEAELSGYRFVSGIVTEITSEQEIVEIEQALDGPPSLKPVRTHLQTALERFADRQKPDYRNSIKESVSAVEALCARISGKRKATLGDALKIVADKVGLHAALQTAFSSLYGYTSDGDGIRHALLDEQNLTSDDAKFMLVACSAFVNYLTALAGRAGLKL
jgi:hypothetical protein